MLGSKEDRFDAVVTLLSLQLERNGDLKMNSRRMHSSRDTRHSLSDRKQAWDSGELCADRRLNRVRSVLNRASRSCQEWIQISNFPPEEEKLTPVDCFLLQVLNEGILLQLVPDRSDFYGHSHICHEGIWNNFDPSSLNSALSVHLSLQSD